MGLLIVADWVSEGGGAGQSTVLWVLLVAAVGLTFWECRERGYRLKALLWWVSFVAITPRAGVHNPAFLRPPASRCLIASASDLSVTKMPEHEPTPEEPEESGWSHQVYSWAHEAADRGGRAAGIHLHHRPLLRSRDRGGSGHRHSSRRSGAVRGCLRSGADRGSDRAPGGPDYSRVGSGLHHQRSGRGAQRLPATRQRLDRRQDRRSVRLRNQPDRQRLARQDNPAGHSRSLTDICVARLHRMPGCLSGFRSVLMSLRPAAWPVSTTKNWG